MAVLGAGGRRAITHYAVEASYRKPKAGIIRKDKVKQAGIAASLVRCRLETGRTHQVRLHMAHKGTPLIADPLYGGGFGSSIRGLPDEAASAIMNLQRQALHAAHLTFRHPATGRTMTFESELPADMKKVREALETLNENVS
jgi:23S rRNA pseudouridine1911/1915/1917 synthase